MRRSTALLLLTALLAATAFSVERALTPTSAQEPETRLVDLAEGWNLVGWTGPTTPLDEAITGIVEQVEAVATFTAASQAFATWNAAGPDFLNTLTELIQGEGAWILVGAVTTWEQPIVPDPDPVALREGFNLLTWTGPSGLDPAGAFAGLGDDLTAAFAFAPETAIFSSYGPARPPFVNDLDPLTYGDGFWALMGTATAWDQPAAPVPFSRTLPGGAVTLTIPRGALAPDVDPAAIQIADITQTPAFAAVADQAENVVVGLDLQPSGLEFAVPVTVTATVPNSVESGLFALLSSGDQLELVTDLALVDGTADTVTVAAAIDHFSILWIVVAPTLVTAANQDVGSVPVGTRFDAAVTATLDATFERVVTAFVQDIVADITGELTQVEHRIVVDPDGVWGLFSRIPFHPLEGAVTPVAPHRQIPPGLTETFVPIEVRQTFSCDGPGDFVILFLSQANVPRRLLEVIRQPERRLSVQVPGVDAFVRGTCTALPGTVTFQTFDASGALDQLVGEIPLGEDFELIIHDEGNPLPPRFPLTITIRLSGQGVEEVVQTVIFDGDPAVVCSDPEHPNWCSLPIDALSRFFERVEISVTDKDGNPIAFAARGGFLLFP